MSKHRQRGQDEAPAWLIACNDDYEHAVGLLRKLMENRLANGSGLILLCLKHETLNASRLQRQTGLPERSLFADLRVLAEQGLIERVKAANKRTSYAITPQGRRCITPTKTENL